MPYYPSQGHRTLLGAIKSANFNDTGDQAIPIPYAKYIIRQVVVTNASTSLTLAAGGVYSATSKGGTTIVAAAQVYTALTAASKWIDLTLAAGPTTDTLTSATIYLSLTTGQGGAATADCYVYGDVLP